MNKVTFLIGALAISMGSFAQSYKLTELPEAAFEAGGDAQWSFEKYNFTTGVYSKLTTCGDSSTCNYVDIYQPERLAGKRITEIAGVTASGENTWAANIRKAWYDNKFESPRTNSMEKFVYVCRDTRDGFGYELYGNKDNSSIITFTAPADGYYKVTGKVIREDVPERAGLHLVPRFRYASQTDINYVNPKSTMGLKFVYGENGGVLDTYDGNGNLSKGGTQQFVEQKPTAFAFAFQAKAGDKVSFEANPEAMNLTTTWARDAYGRTFLQQLDIETVDKAAAEAEGSFIDPYGSAGVSALSDKLNEYSEEKMNLDDQIGSEYGDYTQEAADNLTAKLDEISNAIEDGTVNEMNASIYLEQLEQAWQDFINSKITIDFNADNNHRLFYSTGSLANGNLNVVNNPDLMAQNEDQPWGFYAYDVAKGSYDKLVNHDTNNKSGVSAWYRGTGDWFFISDNGFVHPQTTYSPAIMFTAPADGVYKVVAQAYRTNPEGQTNDLTWRTRFLTKETVACDTATYMYATQYGNKSTDGQKGLKPATLEYFVNMHQGDRISFESDCYLINSNASAGTQIINLGVYSRVTNDKLFTADSARVSGINYYDPYMLGDPTALKASVTTADSIANAHKDEVGTGDGQYSPEKYEALTSLIADANEWIALEGDPSATQLVYDTKKLNLDKAVTAFVNSRLGFHKQLNGTFSLRLAGTKTYLTRKQSAGDHYYMNYMDYAAVVSQAEKDNLQVTDFSWTYTFTPGEENANIISITNEGGYLTADGYVGIGVDPNPAANTFELISKEKEDSAFAVKRADGLYWTKTKGWTSPYDKVNTSAEPQYIFVIDNVTIEDLFTGIDNVNVAGDQRIVRTEYYTADGRLTNAAAKGMIIVRKVFADGTARTVKMFVK